MEACSLGCGFDFPSSNTHFTLFMPSLHPFLPPLPASDERFSDTYQEPLKHLMGDNWWQVESVNKYNTGEFDGTGTPPPSFPPFSPFSN